MGVLPFPITLFRYQISSSAMCLMCFQYIRFLTVCQVPVFGNFRIGIFPGS
nr:MAG TPA: hypothetical protein [Caudoviricetes sp.]